MDSDFTKSLERVLGGGRHEPPRPEPVQARPAQAKDAAATPEARHRKWFAAHAREHVLPLLTHTVEALKRRGFVASCRLVESGDEVVGELVLVPAGLPPHAKPPRFTVAAAPGTQGLAIEYTGTFPHAGPEGGFGAEITYDTVYTSELEEQLLEFVRIAVGA